ncbi:hypothetical protein SCP_0501380 [Sparassis crispa]|uniref:DUF5745 domain-containing protein n=1 Tax=Sparassis crispa TaxID=139825 RepID=A0A401GLP8_9APHY|nr:hypothetical protein SCP_0501380 [Sparassis crispa]GBE83092.1 hypothetical protein SCP_0501380 [Sparassis crispa]
MGSKNLSENSTTEGTLVSTLNSLLVKILIPITLETPQDLTPSLLLAILESINGLRLPIPAAVRASRDFPAKVEAMKVFLGVLENDILRMDVGLSDVDPRKLAAGDWDEVVYVGELLCWLGKLTGLLPHAPEDLQANPTPFRRHSPRAPSPSTHSTVTNSIHSNLSMTRSAPAESDTTVMSVTSDAPVSMSLPELDLFGFSTVHTLPDPRPPSPPSRPRPRCIHEVEDRSFLRDLGLPGDASFTSDLDDSQTSYCNCSLDTHAPAPPRTVRHTGYIAPVDDASEIQSFEASRRKQRSHSPRGPTPPRPALTPTPRHPSVGRGAGFVLTRHTSPAQHTLALLTERARLLAELAAMRASAGASASTSTR